MATIKRGKIKKIQITKESEKRKIYELKLIRAEKRHPTSTT